MYAVWTPINVRFVTFFTEHANGEEDLSGKYLGRSCQADPPPTNIFVDPPNYSNRSSRTAVGVQNIFKSIHKFTTPTPSVESKHPLFTSIPQEIVKFSKILAEQADEIFLQTWNELRGYPELETLPTVAHPTDLFLPHAAENGFPIALPWGMDEQENQLALQYVTHTYALLK